MYTNEKCSVSGALSPGYTSFKKEVVADGRVQTEKLSETEGL